MGIANMFGENFGDNVLTLSGEIIIAPVSPTDKGAILDFDKTALNREMSNIRRKFPILKTECKNGLLEINLEFYCNETRTKNENFLEDFEQSLHNLVQVILSDERFSVRVNVFGKFETLKVIKEYRYLNKGDDVRFMIVDEIFKGGSAKYMRPIFYLIAGIIAACGYFGYRGYQYFMTDKDKTKIEQKADNIQRNNGQDIKKEVNTMENKI